MISHVMNLANSIIGVSVLAMPFCFKQCGILLAVLILLLSNFLSRFACHFLIKSAIITRRKNFEFVASYAFGPMGKLLVELFIIGFLLGTCIAFFVVVGDLGPQIISGIIDRKPEETRTSFLIITAVFIILPLGLLRNIDSLTSINTAAIGFYICLVLKVISESTHHIFKGDWLEQVNFWRPGGILQCLPIFSMALFCQTQLFEIYDSVLNSSLEKMNYIVKRALNICTMVYLCVGIFGYIAYYTQPFSGNILLSFESSFSSEIIKIGFVLSVAFSFPLVIFPCRASLYSLLFKGTYSHDSSTNYIPETKFKYLTIAIISISLMIGISIPSIEFVLGLVGSTIGVMICLILPSAFFISITTKNTNERLLAQIILIVGIGIMVLGTYANLYAMERSSTAPLSVVSSDKSFGQIDSMPREAVNNENLEVQSDLKNLNVLESIEEEKMKIPRVPDKLLEPVNSRQEPPVPVPVEKIVPLDPSKPKEESLDNVERVKSQAQEKPDLPLPVDKKIKTEIKETVVKKEEQVDEKHAFEDEKHHEQLKETLEKHRIEQKELMQEQREILEDIKQKIKKLEKLEMSHQENKNEVVDDEDSKKVGVVKKDVDNPVKTEVVHDAKKLEVDVKPKADVVPLKSELVDNEIPKVEVPEKKIPSENADSEKPQVKKNLSKVEGKKNDFAVPIALKMNGKSKMLKKLGTNESKKHEVPDPARRDLLEDRHTEN